MKTDSTTRYRLVQDNDAHWYIIVSCFQEDWERWLADGDEGEVPDFAEPIGGHPSLVTFTCVEFS